ncbi:hypothetical protein [Hymenobacter edaphi]|uniref:DUF3857 domain-containing protein n=1 Tax=Hymenobacter edaphi TaxID=2211146 RepID=A0A328BED7_9BACT|nr:hypothetical protein [Hymenobacter edaphi]RAK65109.1 hypothetical protein DLM85_16335 [Hymenobacter edaphi]
MRKALTYLTQLLRTLLLLLALAVSSPGRASSLPTKVSITDETFAGYYGTYIYRYELVAGPDGYRLYRTLRQENKLVDSLRHFLKVVDRAAVRRLAWEATHRRRRLTLSDLGLRYEEFGQPRLLDSLRHMRRSWNARQLALARQELARPANIDYAIRRYVLRYHYAVMHRSTNTSFRLRLEYPHKTIVLKASQQPLGLPWRDAHDRVFYNPGLAPLLLALLPATESGTTFYFERHDLLLALARQIYADRCAQKLNALTYLNFQPALARLAGRYPIADAQEDPGSYDWQWQGEPRLTCTARDPALPAGVSLFVSLTIQDDGQLFPPDSLLRKADYYLGQLRLVPFLLDFVAAHPARRLAVSFNNTTSVSRRIRDEQRDKALPEQACLPNATDAYLDRCVSFELRDEDGNYARCLLTPELEVIVRHFGGDRVYRYTREQLGRTEPGLSYPCARLDRNGNLKKQ